MSVQARIDALEEELQTLSTDERVANDEEARQKLLGVAQQATSMLETPSDAIWKLLLTVDLLYIEKHDIELKLPMFLSMESPTRMLLSRLPSKLV